MTPKAIGRNVVVSLNDREEEYKMDGLNLVKASAYQTESRYGTVISIGLASKDELKVGDKVYLRAQATVQNNIDKSGFYVIDIAEILAVLED